MKCDRCHVPFTHLLHERVEVSGPNGAIMIHRSCRSKGDKVIDSKFFGGERVDVSEETKVELKKELTAGAELPDETYNAATVFGTMNSMLLAEKA